MNTPVDLLPVGASDLVVSLLRDRSRTPRERGTQATSYLVHQVCMELGEPAPSADELSKAFAALDDREVDVRSHHAC